MTNTGWMIESAALQENSVLVFWWYNLKEYIQTWKTFCSDILEDVTEQSLVVVTVNSNISKAPFPLDKETS